MADETNEQAPATPKGAKKSREKKVTAAKVGANAIATAASSDALDAEMQQLDRDIKVTQLKIGQRQLQEFQHKESERARRQASAQASLRGEKFGEQQTAAQCQHRLGGFGLEDIYNGDDKPAIVVMDMPIVGMRKVLCIRCPKVWDSPDPRLKKTDPAEYLRQAEEWKEALQLIKQARMKAMGGPTFAFETEQGDPVHPRIL